jgi:hypothetical protein
VEREGQPLPASLVHAVGARQPAVLSSSWRAFWTSYLYSFSPDGSYAQEVGGGVWATTFCASPR